MVLGALPRLEPLGHIDGEVSQHAVRTRLRADSTSRADVLVGLQRDSSGEVFLRLDGRWYSSSLADPIAI